MRSVFNDAARRQRWLDVEAELDTLLDPTGYVGAAAKIVDHVIATVTQGGRLAHDEQGAA